MPYWWEQLAGADGQPLPASVRTRLDWYERQVRRDRRRYYLLEVAVVVISASIPAAAATGASVGATGVLGAVLTVVVGLRQLFRLGENWIRFSSFLVGLQREVVVWSVGAKPYDDPGASALLTTRVESLVADETAQWSVLRRSALPGEVDVTKTTD
jgi:hypothetical protein